MKGLINKFLVLAIASVTLIMGAPAAHAQFSSQLEEKTIPVGEFTGLEVEDDFDVTLSSGPCVAKITVDRVLSPYVQVYVRGKVLHISYDSKAVPKDIRKLYKGRNAPKPVFRANISIPELNSLTLLDNAILDCADVISGGQKSEISLADKSELKSINIQSADVKVSMKKNTVAVMTVKAVNMADFVLEGNSSLNAQVVAHDIKCSTSGSSDMTLNVQSENATFASASSSESNITFNGKQVTINASGTSRMNMSGKADGMILNAERNAKLEAGTLDVRVAEVSLNGMIDANISVSESLSATLLGGSTLYYSGTPVFNIGKVVKSTLAPYGSNR